MSSFLSSQLLPRTVRHSYSVLTTVLVLQTLTSQLVQQKLMLLVSHSFMRVFKRMHLLLLRIGQLSVHYSQILNNNLLIVLTKVVIYDKTYQSNYYIFPFMMMRTLANGRCPFFCYNLYKKLFIQFILCLTVNYREIFHLIQQEVH